MGLIAWTLDVQPQNILLWCKYHRQILLPCPKIFCCPIYALPSIGDKFSTFMLNCPIREPKIWVFACCNCHSPNDNDQNPRVRLADFESQYRADWNMQCKML